MGDVAAAGFFLKSERPDFNLFEAAAVLDPLQVTDFALRQAGVRKNSLQNRIGLPASLTRPDDVLFNLNRLQDGVDNVLQALECRCPRSTNFAENINRTFFGQVQVSRLRYESEKSLRKMQNDSDIENLLRSGEITTRRAIKDMSRE